MTNPIERLLGPHYASRLGDGRDSTAEARLGISREVRNLVAGLFAGSGGLGTVSVVITTYFADDVPDYRPLIVALVTLTAFTAAFVIRPLWLAIGPRPVVLHGLVAGATAMATIASWASGPQFSPFGMIFYIWCALAAGCFLHLRGIIAHLGLIGVGCALVLTLLEPVSSPVARWLLIVGTCLFSGVLVDRFSGRIQAAGIEEAEARDHAELMSARLAEASQHKSDFLASMSHELRTPLNAVIGFSDVLLSRHFGDLNDDQEEYVRDILDSGHHLLALINDVLDLSKVEAGKLDLDPRWFELDECIRASASLVEVRAEQAGVDLRLRPPHGELEAYGDERRIKQVLVNLLNNAVKFTPPGGSVEVAWSRSDGGVSVSVQDTGVGIAPDDLTTIFEDFRQVGDAALAKEGTGLGLALAKQFLELHGGSISVTSILGQGSTFAFRLPDPSHVFDQELAS